MRVTFPGTGTMAGEAFGLGIGVAVTRGPGEPEQVEGEVNWGGLGGTHWWMNPRTGVAGVLMTQRHFGFSNPYSYVFKNLAYRAVGMR